MKTIRNLALSSLVLLGGCTTYQTRVDCIVPVPDVQSMRQGSRNVVADVVQYGSQVMDAVPEVYEQVSGSLNELGNYVEQGSKDLADKIRP